ncbi:diguanylate cyclase [Paenibacillus sp. JX-17]|uniref:Diguanylate cyclase n=2 Tax=Paenibacillus lacisoli TaxID=3064525 RepID=A0ABT9CC12_9BACL|nr:diguanylate cyclase [Paenibacillus sp. JX-17]MDO7906797.1 diguanylate cyclase [Paenibacillus sp. JX-17]
MSKFHTLVRRFEPGNLYLAVLCVAGLAAFIHTNQWSYFRYSTSDWVLVYTMLGAALMMEYFTFQLPPEGNTQSMDSSIYLACIFIYGSELSLSVLLLSSIIVAVYNRKINVWRHMANFSVYCLMIFVSSYVYIWAGGIAGPLDNENLLPYFLALTAYCVTNAIAIGLYYFIRFRYSLYDSLRGFFAESLLVYLCTLILSLILTVLIVHNGILGLLLFLGITILLSHAFKQLFDMYRKIEEKANMDRRTGLFNHSYFENILEVEMHKAKAEGTPLTLALIDIDDFKKYNDHFGHLKGDQLLGFLGERLKQESEGSEVTVSRYGGEEFTLLMPGMELEEAYRYIDRIRKKLNDTYFDGVEIFPHGCLSFSAGVAPYQIDLYDKSQLVDQADKALYYAKKQGKNVVHAYGSHNSIEQEINLGQEIHDIEQQLNLFIYKDIGTFKHSKRVFKYAMDMSEVLQLQPQEKRTFVLGALIHDIGKLELPWNVLNKKEKLTDEEWELIKSHVTWGKRIASTNENFKELIPYIELHHERYDGKGYPYGFRGSEIPRLCRMLTIIDSFDAMTTERPYQQTKSVEQAITELRACAGTQFDPELTELFIRYIQDLHHMHVSSKEENDELVSPMLD